MQLSSPHLIAIAQMNIYSQDADSSFIYPSFKPVHRFILNFIIWWGCVSDSQWKLRQILIVADTSVTSSYKRVKIVLELLSPSDEEKS